jgi:mersacidin/lichenicidin family type 2 lantibiotic
MTTDQIVRAWRDPAYRQSLPASARAALPAHPAGTTELRTADVRGDSGGGFTAAISCGGTPNSAALCCC